MKEQTKPPTVEDAAQKGLLKYARRIHGSDLSPDEEAFYSSVARREPQKVVDYLAAVKEGQGPDPAYAERFHRMKLGHGQRRVLRKSIADEPDPEWENMVRGIEDKECPSR